ncbi:DUF4468 domain-containing protein [Pedobacter suwonensis]|uniref:DUF4468 domain-containing protein n=1 Tax=Pedobacter suwonensis TaxID=332999 RepID=UPI0011A3C28C|nr:DUF4468 domain-containing protein [Pedobacter suwonensis]
MKKLIVILVFIPFIGLSQTFKPDYDTESTFTDQPAYLLDTVSVSLNTKQQLYSNVLSYLTKSFKDSRNVLEMKDFELGEVSFNGIVPFVYIDTVAVKTTKKETIKSAIERNSFLSFKCKIYVKEGKFKIVLSRLKTPSFYFSQDELQSTLRKEFYKPNNQVAKETALGLIRDIAYRINKKPENDF